jgi:hypothetical protein
MMRRFTKMQLNLKGDDELTLDDMIASVKTAHVAANAFYCCLGTCAVANMALAERFALYVAPYILSLYRSRR